MTNLVDQQQCDDRAFPSPGEAPDGITVRCELPAGHTGEHSWGTGEDLVTW